jgi:hypothetical protein
MRLSMFSLKRMPFPSVFGVVVSRFPSVGAVLFQVTEKQKSVTEFEKWETKDDNILLIHLYALLVHFT